MSIVHDVKDLGNGIGQIDATKVGLEGVQELQESRPVLTDSEWQPYVVFEIIGAENTTFSEDGSLGNLKEILEEASITIIDDSAEEGDPWVTVCNSEAEKARTALVDHMMAEE